MEVGNSYFYYTNLQIKIKKNLIVKSSTPAGHTFSRLCESYGVREVVFQDGTVKKYDVAVLFHKYPQMKALQDRNVFLSGKLISPYGIIWTDDLDLETETIYEEGITTRKTAPLDNRVGNALQAARAQLGISQKQLSALSGIDQSDISKIERGAANPSISTLERLAKALGGSLDIRFNISAAS